MQSVDSFTVHSIHGNRLCPLSLIAPSSLATTVGVIHTKRTCLCAKPTKRSGAASRKSKTNNNDSAGNGFAKAKQSSISQEQQQDRKNIISQRGQDADDIYSRPALYDLAFGYRNYEEEVGFLLNVHDRYSQVSHSGKDSEFGSVSGINILELAAGPGRHGITALKYFQERVHACTAIDISREMMEYSNQVADDELGNGGFGGRRDQFQYILQDIRHISLENQESENEEKSGDNISRPIVMPESFDSAWLLLGSMQHLTRNDDVISCFSCVSNLLHMGGTLIIELPHPRETFTMVECTRNGWEVPLEDEFGQEYGELSIVWGDENDKFDPIRQVRDLTVAMDLTVTDKNVQQDDVSGVESVKQVVPLRLFTFQEIEAMARLGGFEVAGLYGALNEEVDVDNEDEAFRLICVLRKNRMPLTL